MNVEFRNTGFCGRETCHKLSQFINVESRTASQSDAKKTLVKFLQSLNVSTNETLHPLLNWTVVRTSLPINIPSRLRKLPFPLKTKFSTSVPKNALSERYCSPSGKTTVSITPQSVNAFGGFKVQGKGEEAAQKLLDDARAVEEAGAFAVVLECVPKALAKKITESISIPTIGIGAGADCDGQVLVYQDMLAMYANMKPKFVKQFAQVGKEMNEAFTAYKKAVSEGTFPAEEHTFKMDETIIDKLY